ncbi:MAG: AsmA family protein [Gammaproteobacteria bacterium]|nr:MAG: AsmA family protein [Gammaproteobacteria bacterium]
MRFLKILTWIAVLLLVLVGASVIVIQNTDWNLRRARLEQAVTELAGRELKLTGDLDFTLFPRPTLTAGGLALANVDWASDPKMLEADAVTFVFKPLSLLTGSPRTKYIGMRGVKLTLEENDDGQDNWAFGDGSGSGFGWGDVLPYLKTIEVEDALINYAVAGEEPLQIGLHKALLHEKAIGSVLDVDVEGSLNDKAFTVTGETSYLNEYLLGGSFGGDLHVTRPGYEYDVVGKYGRFTGLEGVDLHFKGKGTRLPTIAQLAEIPDKYRGEWEADFKLSGDKAGYRITDADIQMAERSFKGSLAFNDASGYSGKFGVVTPDYQFDADGNFGTLRDAEGIDATINGHGTRFPGIGVLASIPENLREDWQAALHVKSAQDKILGEDVKLRIGESDLAGTITVDRAGSRPMIHGDLTSKFLDVGLIRRSYTDAATDDDKGPMTPSEKIFSSSKFSLEWLRDFDASLQIAADRLQMTFFTYLDAVMRVNLDLGRLEFKGEKGSIYGADSLGTLVVDASVQPPTYTMDVIAKGADVKKVIGDWTDPPFLSGQGDFDLKLNARGDSIAAVMGSMSGQVRLLVGEGEAMVGILERMVKTVGLKQLETLFGDEKVDSVPMNCLAADLVAEDGVVTAEVFILDTERATIRAKGDVDLGKEEWDLVLKPKPKVASLSTAVPIHVGGPLNDPNFSPAAVGTLRKLAGIASLFVFPPAAVAGLADVGSGHNICVELAAEKD